MPTIAVDMARKSATKAHAKVDGLEAIDDAWKSRVLALMERESISKKALADYCGVVPSAISYVFAPETKATKLRRKIAHFVGMPAERTVEIDDRLRRLLDRWEDLPEADRDLVLQMIDRIKPAT
jgi:hypothetical protein